MKNIQMTATETAVSNSVIRWGQESFTMIKLCLHLVLAGCPLLLQNKSTSQALDPEVSSLAAASQDAVFIIYTSVPLKIKKN